MYRVLVTARSFGTADNKAAEFLKENHCRLMYLSARKETGIREQLEEEMATADAVIAGLEEYDERLLETAEKLKVISRYGVGCDKINISAAKRKNIVVTITPGANGDAVADLAMALMLNLARGVSAMDQSFKSGERKRFQGVELWGKTLGIIGTGRIGRGVARRCSGFNMKILCHDIYPDKVWEKEQGVTYVPLEELLACSDFISIHSPLTEKTRNLIGAKEFSRMKHEAIIVNTARGGIIHEAALYEALKNGVIRGAALDALANEGSCPRDLMSLPNCILTPHAGAATKEAVSKMSYMAAENVIEVFKTGNCRYAVS